MEHQYRMADLSHYYIDGRPFFPTISQPPPMLTYDMPPDSTLAHAATAVALPAFEAGLTGGGDGGSGRWPRQETLTLLEIRSRLDPKFKEANQKAPLWDEVSRIMSEESGYQRSGKKCREKFENLYKYYKKTKEGKSGRQDGKHYRFFRQLEALYGQTSNPVSISRAHFHSGGGDFRYNFPNSLASVQETCLGSKISDTSSAPDSCDYDTTSSYCSDSSFRLLDIGTSKDDSTEKKRRGKRILKAKIEESIDAQMKSVMEKQEVWMEKMTRVIESKEQERMIREEQWRKQDSARIEREQKMWASEKAWIEARDVALMEAFNKVTGQELKPRPPILLKDLITGDGDGDEDLRDVWPESGFQENGIWEEAIGCSSLMCREKLDQIINDYQIKSSKTRNDHYKSSCTNTNPIDAGVEGAMRVNGYGNEPTNDGLLRYYQRL